MPEGWQSGSYETRGAGWFCFGPQPPPRGHCEKDISADVIGMCRGKQACMIPASRSAYGSDPCAGIHGPGPGFQVAVRVTCAPDDDLTAVEHRQQSAVREHSFSSTAQQEQAQLQALFSMQVTVPPGSLGELHVPLFFWPLATIMEGATVVWATGRFTPVAGIESASNDGRFVIFNTLSGTYNFTVMV